MGAAPILTILKNGETVRSVALEGDALLGRSEGCIIRLEDRAISRQHAFFRRNGNQVQVERKSEFAPLSVNGQECTTALLKEGDVISIGPYLMKLSLLGVEAAVSPSAPVAAAPISEAVLENIKVDDPPIDDLMPVSSEPESSPHQDVGVDAPPADENIISGESGSQDPIALVADSEFPALEPAAALEEVDKTRVAPQVQPEIHLIFSPGQANVTDFKVDKERVSIGRGKDCDIVINDKKSSRKNAVIIRNGMSFLIRDLESSNGTYLNGEKITEKELAGGDEIRIGDVAFYFRAEQPGYADREKDFMPVPEEPQSAFAEELPPFEAEAQNQSLSLDMQADQGLPALANGAFNPATVGRVHEGMPSGTLSGIAGVPGFGGASSGKRKSLMERFRAMPKRQQYIVIALVLSTGWWLMDDDAPTPVKKKTKAPTAQVAGTDKKDPPVDKDAVKAFEALTPEQKKFVQTQHELAFNYYKNREYDKSLFEIQKVFTLVGDYKDSREIERYAREGKRKMEALADEKRKREEDAVLKQKIADLINDGRDKMEHKKYDQMPELFSQILALDPENAQVAQWQKKIQKFEEDRRIDAQKRSVQEEINKQGWAIYDEGMKQRKAGKLRDAIAVFEKVKDVGSTDEKLNRLALSQIKGIRAQIQSLVTPLLKEAKDADTAGEHARAINAYYKVLGIEPEQGEAILGINRLKGMLNERAKAFYTEAILAESYSDFAVAKKKFQACLEVAPRDSLYRERAERKLMRYFKQADDSPPEQH